MLRVPGAGRGERQLGPTSRVRVHGPVCARRVPAAAGDAVQLSGPRALRRVSAAVRECVGAAAGVPPLQLAAEDGGVDPRVWRLYARMCRVGVRDGAS